MSRPQKSRVCRVSANKTFFGLSVHSFASNWQLPFLNQWKGENSRRNCFKSQWKNVAGPGLEPATPWLDLRCISWGFAYQIKYFDVTNTFTEMHDTTYSIWAWIILGEWLSFERVTSNNSDSEHDRTQGITLWTKENKVHAIPHSLRSLRMF